MTPITDPKQVEHYRALVREMMLHQEGREYELDPEWVSSHAWRVVPVESAMRIPREDIPRLVSVLRGAGYTNCIAVVNENGCLQPLTPGTEVVAGMPTCYLLSVEESSFQEFNRELGPFRSVLTSADRTWAISCNESYNLFASRSAMLESLLGEPIEQARREFLEFASLVAKGNAEEPLMRVAKHYAAL